MKILKNDTRHNRMTVMPETEDDLWLLEKILEKGDIISGKTNRTIIIPRGDKKEKVRKTIFVRLAAEKLGYEPPDLRVSGKILEAPEEVEHGQHTFEITAGEPVTIEKQWLSYQVDQLYAAKRKAVRMLLCVLDDSEADFALLTERMQHLATISGVTGKSLGEQDKSTYYKEILSYIQDAVKSRSIEKIIIAGPGFAKENIQKLLKNSQSELKSMTHFDSTAHTGEPGLQELLKRGIVDRVSQESNIAEQTELVEQFLARLAKSDRIVYGLRETEGAIKMGAVDMLLVSDTQLRNNQQLLREAEKTGAKVKIIDTSHEAGMRLDNLGGIAGFLRYKMAY